jgi:methenyltetrahydromethanopterin cyclohydrolase
MRKARSPETNDAILYGGTAYYAMEYDNEGELQKIVDKAPSMASKDYGKPFIEYSKKANLQDRPKPIRLAVLAINNVGLTTCSKLENES